MIQDFSTSLVVQIDRPYGCEPTSKLLNTQGSSNTRYNQLWCLVARAFWHTCDVYFPNSISVQLSIHESNDRIYYPMHVEWIKSDVVNHVCNSMRMSQVIHFIPIFQGWHSLSTCSFPGGGQWLQTWPMINYSRHCDISCVSHLSDQLSPGNPKST